MQHLDDGSRRSLAREIDAVSRLQGRFVLRSGEVSDVYFDKYRFEAEPAILARIAQALRPLIPPECEVLAGLELGGVPICTALSLASGLPAAFVRKRPKDYGTRNLSEGAPVQGRKVCVVEDVISTGGQVRESTLALRALGADVVAIGCVVRRTGLKADALTELGIPVFALFTQNELADPGAG